MTHDETRDYTDPTSEGNHPRYRTGRECIMPACKKEAGTAWSKYFCVKHSANFMRQVEAVRRRVQEQIEGVAK
ncbi:hypothetical protein [Paraburkholderia sp. BCC1885]|uniref:hypothetical protein n=1 Tax=Paraburkholderia sp. BCC1885 TaxID=2562669 RepID=UPI0011824DA6|nr:hypothetical protein [Paraburkholderia sp. BCC1885]